MTVCNGDTVSLNLVSNTLHGDIPYHTICLFHEPVVAYLIMELCANSHPQTSHSHTQQHTHTHTHTHTHRPSERLVTDFFEKSLCISCEMPSRVCVCVCVCVCVFALCVFRDCL